MRWSIPIARIFGIDLKLHLTFFLVIVLGAMMWSGFGPAGAAFGALLMVLLFACVTLHEFGHAVVAQRLGIPVREIVLLPIGGVAVLARNPDRPLHEVLIAAAGPAVNVAIAIGLSVALSVKAGVGGLDPAALVRAPEAGPSLAAALVWLLNANVILVLFNLIPAFPLDGGRILRGVLGLFMAWPRATAVATSTGQVLAVGLGVWAIVTGNLVLLVIAILIFMSAGATNVAEQARTVLATRRVGDAYNKHAITLDERDRVSRVADYVLTSYQPDFAVLRDGHLVGVVMRGHLIRTLATRLDDPVVAEVMATDVPRVHATTTLDQVQQLLTMDPKGPRVAAVCDDRGFLGLVSGDDIAEATAVLTFLRRTGHITDGRGDSPARPLPVGVRRAAIPA